MKLASIFRAAKVPFFLLVGLASANQSVHANIIGDDDRRELEHFSLSADEREALYETVGRIECRRRETIGHATAFIVDGGRHILTNAHVFREGDQQCAFSRKRSNQSIPIDVDKATLGAKYDGQNKSLDWAIVPLKTEISTAVFRLGKAPQIGEELFAVGVLAKGKELDPSRLVGRRCTAVVRVDHPVGQNSLLNDCDMIPGDSGSPVFARRNGVLELVGVHEAGSPVTANGKPFSLSDGDRSFSSALILEGPLLEMLQSRFGAAPSATLQKSYRDPAVKPLAPVNYLPQVSAPDPSFNPLGFNRLIKPEPAPARAELSLDGIKLRDLSPGDQILYGIPDDIKGVIVASSGSRTDILEGEVLLGETLERLAQLHDEGIVSLTVKVRKADGQTTRQTLSIE